MDFPRHAACHVISLWLLSSIALSTALPTSRYADALRGPQQQQQQQLWEIGPPSTPVHPAVRYNDRGLSSLQQSYPIGGHSPTKQPYGPGHTVQRFPSNFGLFSNGFNLKRLFQMEVFGDNTNAYSLGLSESSPSALHPMYSIRAGYNLQKRPFQVGLGSDAFG